MVLLRKWNKKHCSPCSRYCIFTAEASGLVAFEGLFFENVKIKVTVYFQTFVTLEVFILLEHNAKATNRIIGGINGYELVTPSTEARTSLFPNLSQ